MNLLLAAFLLFVASRVFNGFSGFSCFSVLVLLFLSFHCFFVTALRLALLSFCFSFSGVLILCRNVFSFYGLCCYCFFNIVAFQSLS